MAAEDYTQFRLPTLPTKAIAKVDGVAAVIGVWYNQGQALTFEKQDLSHFGEPYDQCEYQTTDGVNVSEVSTIIINALPDKNVALSASNDTEVVANDADSVIGDLLNLSNSVDRIKIVSYKNVGELKLNGGFIYPNIEIFRYDLENFVFSSGEEGKGDDYQEIVYQVGNADGYSATEYTLTFSIAGQSSLELVSEDDYQEGDFYYKSAILKIADGFIGLLANLTMDVTISVGDIFPGGTENYISLNYNSNEDVVQDTAQFPFSVTIDDSGSSNIYVLMKVHQDDLPITGSIDIELVDVDGDTGKVSVNNSISLPILLPPSI